MTPEEIADLLHACDLMAPAGDATTTRLNGADIWPVVKAARAYAEMAASQPAPAVREYSTVEELDAILNKPEPNVVVNADGSCSPAPAVAQDGVTEEMVRAAWKRLLIEVGGMTEDNWHLTDSIVQVTEEDLAIAIAPLLAENASLKEEAAGACFEYARAERAEADANRLVEVLRDASDAIRQSLLYIDGTPPHKHLPDIDWLAATDRRARKALAEHDKGGA